MPGRLCSFLSGFRDVSGLAFKRAGFAVLASAYADVLRPAWAIRKAKNIHSPQALTFQCFRRQFELMHSWIVNSIDNRSWSRYTLFTLAVCATLRRERSRRS